MIGASSEDTIDDAIVFTCYYCDQAFMQSPADIKSTKLKS